MMATALSDVDSRPGKYSVLFEYFSQDECEYEEDEGSDAEGVDDADADSHDSDFLISPFELLALPDRRQDDDSDDDGDDDDDDEYFDDEETNTSDNEDVVASRESQGRLLLVSLLENFCSLYDRRPERNRRLYLALCRRLSSLGILQSSDFVDENVNLRTAYRNVFKDLVLEAIHESKEEEGKLLLAEPSPTSTTTTLTSTATITASTTGSSSVGPSTGTTVAFSSRLTMATGGIPLYGSNRSRDSFVDLFVPVPTSRFAEDFVEEMPLGKGAFGQVVLARNKLDGKRYAIKKISFASRHSLRYERIQREVQCLAELDHPNIVRYHSAWVEVCHADGRDSDTDEDEDAVNPSELLSYTGTAGSSPSRPSSPSQEEDERGARWTIYIQMELCKFTLADWLKERDRLIFQEATNPLTSPPTSSCGENSPPPPTNTVNRVPAQRRRKLSLGTLRADALISERRTVNVDENRRIFKQIVKGLVHIHDRGLVHRDLKPQNIFFQGSANAPTITSPSFLVPSSLDQPADFVPKIGDFGLVSDVATMLRERERHHRMLFAEEDEEAGGEHGESIDAEEMTSQSSMTGGLGTSTYASPEQLKGAAYDAKADIYSLGIILFELFHPFRTQMERAVVLRELKEQQHFPPAFVRRYPREAAFIWSCVSADPALRPTAREIVGSEFLDDPDDVDDTLALLARENDTLRTMLEWTERDVHALHELTEVQQVEIDFLRRQLADATGRADSIGRPSRAVSLSSPLDDPDNSSSSSGGEH